MTATELIKETYEFYAEDLSRCAVEGQLCCYLTEDGRRCAVGRCLREDVEAQNFFGTWGLLYNYVARNHPDRVQKELLLKPEYRGFSIKLWDDLQTFHDVHMMDPVSREAAYQDLLKKWEGVTNDGV